MTSVDVIPLGDQRKHRIPEGYKDVPNSTAWVAVARRIDGLFPLCWCSPTIEPRIYSATSLATIYVHHAKDERQAWQEEPAA